MRYNKVYLIIICLLLAALAIVFNTFPRSTFSELEKRELARFPEFTTERLLNGTFTYEVSSWFSDSEPFRDRFMWLNMQVKDLIRLKIGKDHVSFHAAKTKPENHIASETKKVTIPPKAEEPYVYENHITANENAKITHAGIIIVGSGKKVRALMAYGGSEKGSTGYAQAANQYKDSFPDVNVYCMVIPTAVEYYCPDKVRNRTCPQRPTITHIFRNLSAKVKPVDIYAELGRHADEDIYLRTDHHWAALGAYYAARKFAEVAGVPFRPLSAYDKKIIHNFVGNMYGYSQDIAVRNAPEDFIYYVPRDVAYSTTYTDYTIDKNYRVVSMGSPHQGTFFQHFKNGSGAAYCTFMGSDARITRVETSTNNGRRLLILKDSFGNAIPGYLFYSFEQVHVIDSRYFTMNMVEYVRTNGITDILFANNIFKAYSNNTYTKYIKYLSQTTN